MKIRYYEVEFGKKPQKAEECDAVNIITGLLGTNFSIVIKAEYEPTIKEVADFCKTDLEEVGYDGIYSVTPITREELEKYFDYESVDSPETPTLTRTYGEFPTIDEVKRDYNELMSLVKDIKTIEDAIKFEEEYGIEIEINGALINDYVSKGGTNEDIEWIRYCEYGCLDYIYVFLNGDTPMFDVYCNCNDNDILTDVTIDDIDKYYNEEFLRTPPFGSNAKEKDELDGIFEKFLSNDEDTENNNDTKEISNSSFKKVRGYKVLKVYVDEITGNRLLYDVAVFGEKSKVIENTQLCENIFSRITIKEKNDIIAEYIVELPLNHINDMLVLL